MLYNAGMSDESAFNRLDAVTREQLERVLANQPPPLESPLIPGSNIFDDIHFVAAFQAVADRKLRVVGEEVTIGEYVDHTTQIKSHRKEFAQLLGLKKDPRDPRRIIFSYLTSDAAKHLPRDDQDLKEGSTRRRVEQYTAQYRDQDVGIGSYVYKFLRKVHVAEDNKKYSWNIGYSIGLRLIPLLDTYTPLWISYIQDIYEDYPTTLRLSGYVDFRRARYEPKILSYSEWAEEKRLSFDVGIRAQMQMLGYRATLREHQRRNPPPRDTE